MTTQNPTFRSLPSGNWALSIAHPGHELRMHGFLEMARPYTFILTDNSEEKGQDLMWDTIKVIDRATKQGMSLNPAQLKNPDLRKALKVSLKESAEKKEHIKDSQIQYDLVNRHIDFFRYYVDFMVENLIKYDITHLACDASEDYHPVHEIVRMIAELAVTRMKNVEGKDIALYDFALSRPYDESLTEDCVKMELDEDMLDRKLKALVNYPLGIMDLKPNISIDLNVINELRKLKDGEAQIKALLREINLPFLQTEYLRPARPFEDTENYRTLIAPVYGKLLHSMMTQA